MPGDPAFDDHLLREYRSAVDELSANGATVLWLKGPCARSVEVNGVQGTSEGAYSTERVRYLDDVIIPRLMEERPGVRTFDLFPILCPGGQFVESLGGIDEVRPDGCTSRPRVPCGWPARMARRSWRPGYGELDRCSTESSTR